MEKRIILWDWNGTLLNDVQMCVQCMNVLLKKRHLKTLTPEHYRNVFGFPVKDYYAKIGFDFSREDFSVPAKEFMDLYHRFLPETALFPCVVDVLEYFKNKGFRQFVVSAMEHKSLTAVLRSRNILSFFEAVSGIDNIYAGGKTAMARTFIRKQNLPAEEIVFIGDTLHDLEVARHLGVDCLLVSAGHQAPHILSKETSRVVSRLSDTLSVLGNGELHVI